MKYYLIAGEASGDLHASHLMAELRRQDAQAEFRFYGGDLMLQACGGNGNDNANKNAGASCGTLVKHYRELAYMGFVPVLLHLPTILRNMRQAKRDIRQWQPDALILVDYPGFNLSIAKYVRKWKVESGKWKEESEKWKEESGKWKEDTLPLVCYYISPKIWAWKEYRIKTIKRCIDHLYSILPFEVDFFERKHHYPIHYVGNPTADEVRAFRQQAAAGSDDFLQRHGLEPGKPVIALLCGSRRQEIKDNLPAMLQATDALAADYQVVIAGAPAIEPDYYAPLLQGHQARLLPAGNTYALLCHAHAALVTSGTATLETALFGVPQVVCYAMSMPRLMGWLRRRVLKVKYISLVNLIADREVVSELVADSFTQENLCRELQALLPADSPRRQQMLQGYREVQKRLGQQRAPENAARLITEQLRGHVEG